MKRELAIGAVLLLALGLMAGAIRALDLLGAETLRLLALILAVPAGVAVMAVGLTPLVRAWRVPATLPPERHVIRETRMHTVEKGRPAEPALSQVHPYNLYPALQSPEWRAGLIGDGRGNGKAAYWGAEPEALDLPADAWDDWERDPGNNR